MKTLKLALTLLILLVASPALAQPAPIRGGSGPGFVPDLAGTPATLSAVDNCAIVALSGRQGATATFALSDFNGTIVGKVATNPAGVADYTTTALINSNGVEVDAYLGDGSNAAEKFGIVLPHSVTHAAVCVTVANSGSVSAQVFATAVQGGQAAGTTGSGFKFPRVVTATPTPGTPGWAQWCGNCGSAVSGETFTSGSSSGITIFGVRRDTWTDVADGKTGEVGMTAKGGLFVNPRGSDGTDPYNTTLQGFGVVVKNVVPVGFKTGAASIQDAIACPTRFSKRVTSITTTEVLPVAASGEIWYVCSMDWKTTAANNITWKEGTQTTNPCDTNTATIREQEDYAADQGKVLTSTGPWVMKTETAARQLCVTTSSAGPFTTSGYAVKF